MMKIASPKGDFFILGLGAMLLLSACGHRAADEDMREPGKITEESEAEISTEDIPYMTYLMDAVYCGSAEEMVAKADVVLLGKITGISFQVYDLSTEKLPTESSDSGQCRLNTVYETDILRSYKGDLSGSMEFRVMVGWEDAYRKEQAIALKESAQKATVPLIEGSQRLEVGETYLLLLSRTKDGEAYKRFHYFQGAYRMNDPLKTDRDKIAPKDIISCFGEDEWDKLGYEQ